MRKKVNQKRKIKINTEEDNNELSLFKIHIIISTLTDYQR